MWNIFKKLEEVKTLFFPSFLEYDDLLKLKYIYLTFKYKVWSQVWEAKNSKTLTELNLVHSASSLLGEVLVQL